MDGLIHHSDRTPPKNMVLDSNLTAPTIFYSLPLYELLSNCNSIAAIPALRCLPAGL